MCRRAGSVHVVGLHGVVDVPAVTNCAQTANVKRLVPECESIKLETQSSAAKYIRFEVLTVAQ